MSSTSDKKAEKARIQPSGFGWAIEVFYEKHYKKMALIPTIFGVIALILIFVQFYQTGDFMNRGVGLKGGTTISILTSIEPDTNSLESALSKEFPGEDFNIQVLKEQGLVQSLSIETSVTSSDVDKIVPLVEAELGTALTTDDYSIQTIGSSLSESFFQELVKILILAFILMGLVVFFYFRSPIPSIYVILCAFFDMVITLAIINVFGIKITTGGIAAFLMLIDFSIDTDTLLTAKILRREKGVTPFQAIVPAMITGLTMTLTAFAAMFTAYILSTSQEIKQIMIILLIGLIVDLVVTWMQNGSLCIWYALSKEKKNEHK